MAVEKKNKVEICGVIIPCLNDSQIISLLRVFAKTKDLLERGKDDPVMTTLQLAPYFPELISRVTGIEEKEIGGWEAGKVFAVAFAILKLNEEEIMKTFDKLGNLQKRGIFTNGKVGFT